MHNRYNLSLLTQKSTYRSKTTSSATNLAKSGFSCLCDQLQEELVIHIYFDNTTKRDMLHIKRRDLQSGREYVIFAGEWRDAGRIIETSICKD